MRDRIEINPHIHFGKPCVAGTRIPVLDVLELVSEDIPFETITRDYYPDLQVEDIRACVRYAMEIVNAEDIHISGSRRARRSTKDTKPRRRAAPEVGDRR